MTNLSQPLPGTPQLKTIFLFLLIQNIIVAIPVSCVILWVMVGLFLGMDNSDTIDKLIVFYA